MSDPETPMPPTPPAPPGAGRGLKVALAASLAVNLLILGLVAGAILGRDGPDDVPGLRTLGLGPFALALDRDARAGVRDRLAADATPLRGDRRALGRSLVALQTALRADPFDRDLAEDALSRVRQSSEALQARGHGALLDELETLPLAERIAIADRLVRIVRRGVGGGDDRGGRDGSPGGGGG